MSATPSAFERPILRTCLLVGAWLVLPALVAYQNTFNVPFLFDDLPALAHESGVRQSDRLGAWLQSRPDAGETTSGRPIVAFTLALNHALSGERVWSYHAFNLLVHLLAGLALFGVVRRTLGMPGLRSRFGPAAGPLGLAIAALWLLHPLQTESVTYIAQRAESLLGLFFLLTVLAVIRATQSAHARGWLALSWAACLLGMATKEVMVAAPLVVLLYDRTFVAGTFRDAWRQRRGYYGALAGTWLLLAVLVAGTHGRGGTAGFDTVVSPWHYFLTQCHALTHYLRLTIWPTPLVFDYGTAVIRHPGEILAPAAILVALAAATAWAVVRKLPWGFAGFWFFAILAPSSSIVPVASQTMAEHRIYLALAAPLAGAVLMLQGCLGRRSLTVIVVLGIACGALAHRRNRDYHSELTLWQDTAAKRPANARAHHNLGLAELKRGDVPAAFARFETALAIQPRAAESHYNLGLCLVRLGRPAEAISPYERALTLQPDHAETHNNLGNALLALSRTADARMHYEHAVRLKPALAVAHSNLGDVLLRLGQVEPALQHSLEALRLDPELVAAHFNAANAFAESRRFTPARTHYEAALKLSPDDASAHNNLANVLVELDALAEAISHYQRALAIRSNFINPRRNLALLLLNLGRPAEALPHLEILARLLPGDPDIARALAHARETLPR